MTTNPAPTPRMQENEIISTPCRISVCPYVDGLACLQWPSFLTVFGGWLCISTSRSWRGGTSHALATSISPPFGSHLSNPHLELRVRVCIETWIRSCLLWHVNCPPEVDVLLQGSSHQGHQDWNEGFPQLLFPQIIIRPMYQIELRSKYNISRQY
jgi:hypothetical protein